MPAMLRVVWRLEIFEHVARAGSTRQEFAPMGGAGSWRQAMDWDDERPRPKPTITVGERLDQHSVSELEERIVALTAEIERVEVELQAKKARAAAADALFKG
jgi:uncharacterized small protein (DUF1192 family)